VYGRTPDNHPFRGHTRTISVNAFGANIAIDAPVIPGQSILLVHSLTQEERECRVVNVEQTRRGMYRVGIEFVRAGDNIGEILAKFPATPKRQYKFRQTPIGSRLPLSGTTSTVRSDTLADHS
jgi:hypothetical protein